MKALQKEVCKILTLLPCTVLFLEVLLFVLFKKRKIAFFIQNCQPFPLYNANFDFRCAQGV